MQCQLDDVGQETRSASYFFFPFFRERERKLRKIADCYCEIVFEHLGYDTRRFISNIPVNNFRIDITVMTAAWAEAIVAIIPAVARYFRFYQSLD